MSATCSDCEPIDYDHVYQVGERKRITLCPRHAQVDALVEALSALLADTMNFGSFSIKGRQSCSNAQLLLKQLIAMRSGKEKP